MLITFAHVIPSSVTTASLAITAACKTLQQRPQDSREKQARSTTLQNVNDTEKEAEGCGASHVCLLACPVFRIPFPVFIVFLISCCGRHRRLAPALETFYFMRVSRPTCCLCLTKCLAHNTHVSSFWWLPMRKCSISPGQGAQRDSKKC